MASKDLKVLLAEWAKMVSLEEKEIVANSEFLVDLGYRDRWVQTVHLIQAWPKRGSVGQLDPKERMVSKTYALNNALFHK